MSTIGGATWDTAAPIAAGETSPESTVSGYAVGSLRPYYRAWWSIASATLTSLSVDILASTASGNSLMLYVFSGDSEATEVQVGYDSYSGKVTWTAQAGVTYHILVGTYFTDATTGGYILNAADLGPPAAPSGNDNFANATALTIGETSAPANNAGNTLESGEPSLSGQDKTAWWVFTATATGTVKVDTYYSGASTRLGVYTGTAVNALTQLASATSSGTDRAACDVAVTAGTTYYVQVDTNNATGPADLSVSAAYLGSATAGPIGMGSPDEYFYGNPKFYQGGTLPNIEGNSNMQSQGVNYTTTMEAHSSAPTGAMSDSDTGSYISLDNPGFNTDMVAAYAGGPYYMSAMGRLDASPNIPSNFDQIFVSFTMAARSTTTDHQFARDIYCYDASKNNAGLPGVSLSTPAATTAWATTTSSETQITSSTAGAVDAARQNINARRLMVIISPRSSPTYAAPTGVDDFAYLAATFRWTTYDRPAPYGVTIVPPLRQWPRSDALGASSARRLWPLSPSIQASNRKVGGYL